MRSVGVMCYQVTDYPNPNLGKQLVVSSLKEAYYIDPEDKKFTLKDDKRIYITDEEANAIVEKLKKPRWYMWSEKSRSMLACKPYELTKTVKDN